MEQSNARFEELKRKFATALRLIDDSRISLQNLQLQDNKLLIRVALPSEDLRAGLMRELEAADPSLDEVIADIRVAADGNVPNTGQTNVHSGLEFGGDVGAIRK